MKQQLILIRSDEIGTKGRNRPMFEQRLAANLAATLNIPSSHIEVEKGRIYIRASIRSQAWLRRIDHVFGVKSFSLASRVPFTLEEMESEAVALARREVEQGARTFKVEAKRGIKTFPLKSMEMCAHLGRIVLQAVPQLKVDVHEPDFRLKTEVRSSGIILSTQHFAGPGGLPVGINGKALLSLSGGIDSPVAGWMVMKRGVGIDAVYFHSPPYTGEKAKEKVFELARVLSDWKAAWVKVYVVFFTDIQVETSKLVSHRLWTIVHRRFMQRIAERIAQSHDYDALITGESVGQVASQTVRNMQCIGSAVTILTLRPLTGFDKSEIIDRAKRIGTYDISVLPYEDCCTVFAAKHPKTQARLDEIEEAESRLDVERLEAGALERMELFETSTQR